MSKPSNLRIEDVAAVTARSDLNDILISLASLQTTDGDGVAYTGEPTSTYPNMLWYDKATSILKVRTTADDAWINVAYVDQSANAYRILDNTQVTNTSGTQTGLLGDQSTATWESGVGTTESLVSPAKIKAAINAFSFGTDQQSWTNVTASRSTGTTYTNTTGRAIVVNIETNTASAGSADTTICDATVAGVTFTFAYFRQDDENYTATSRVAGNFIVPAGDTYSVSISGNTVNTWHELR
jgi:hypothetical protein